jgi:16S rRNA A1518/A1519 N6-dimethyltransferase RsmA/KsgA/DIM1 with predicted DNA glycosylase/AP lyase activity
LTKLIKDVSQHFLLFEKDRSFEGVLGEILSGNDNYQVVWGDVLGGEMTKVLDDKSPAPIGAAPFLKGGITKVLVVGNLPYYITSPILRKFFVFGSLSDELLSDMCPTYQNLEQSNLF